ncbi:hypothetical protein I4U23_030194 [Adineta vaga]|nr:hypothetical protein I4U23_030194 [Adineta vaga]
MATNENGTSKDLSIPIVSLEEATAALVSIVPEVEKMVMTVKRVRNISTDDLTNDESASISLYTLYWEPKDKSFAVFLDTALQTTNTNVLKPWFLYLKLIMTAFAKLPLVVSHTTIYRAIKLNLIAQYPSKEIFIWWSFTKCTTNIDEFNKDHILGHSGPRTLFIIDCRSSKNIRQHSFYSRDDVLLPFGCQYQVLGCFNSGNGLSVVHIKEISSTYQSSNTTPLLPLLPSIPLNPKPKLIVPTSATILPAIQTSERRMSKILSKKPLITQRPLKRPIELVTIQPRRSLPTSINTKFKEIIESLNSGSQLINLDLSRSQITDAEIKILAEKLQQNKTVTTLNLHHNFIGPQGAHDLANVLKENTVNYLLNQLLL